jgi:hypothetical protein
MLEKWKNFKSIVSALFQKPTEGISSNVRRKGVKLLIKIKAEIN